jgi:hypothetical protein
MQGRKGGPVRWVGWSVVVCALCLTPGTAPGVVNPVTLIQRQVIKPNMLFLFDTSTSMIGAPGENDLDSNEVGVDCDEGDNQCRMVGAPGRCFYSGGGAMGGGVRDDDTSCHSDAECRIGYCKSNYPKDCDKDSDCGSGNYCRGFCSHSNSTACTRDSDCGGTNKCKGICSQDASIPKCTSDSQCTAQAGDLCVVFSDDVCITSGTPAKSKMCVLTNARCRTDADCPTAGDACGAASSRLVVAKRVVSNIVSSYYNTVNFGLMTFYQDGYYPYYPVSGTITNSTVTRFLDKDELKALDCWTKKDGPSGSCQISGQTYNRRNNPDSKYRVKTGAQTYTTIDNNWCGTGGTWCTLPSDQGTGYYLGSYYTYTDPQATADSRDCSASDLSQCLSGETCCTQGGYDKCCRIEPTYKGKTLTVGSQKYVYWTPPVDHRNKANIYGDQNYPLDIVGGSGAGTCCATCGGRGDSKVAPFMDTTDNAATAKTNALAIIAKMEKAGQGGLGMGGYTPTGCALSFGTSAEASDYNNARSYMQKVKSTDGLQNCRNNYVVLITDGAPNRAYDAACDSAACAASPLTAACTCRAVHAAAELLAVGVKTVVVGFSSETANPYPRDTLNNVAKAGGTGAAYFAVREQELEDAIVIAIYQAAQGSYSTSPASSSSGFQTATSLTLGTMVLDTRVDFPGWKGQLIAYETSSGTPELAWSANTVAFNPAVDPNFWKKRNIWTSSGTTMVKIDVDATTGAINNKATLKTLGLGATDAEAERVARWLLGDPAMGNPAVLGAIINSTPIDVGPPGISPLPGGQAFYDAHVSRPYLTYTGSSDGMLHAFFTHNVTVGGKSYLGGQEAFAYLPQTMLPVANKLFAQGGQLPDPKDHIYGLANSPKVKSLCTQNCDGTSGTPSWKTVLVMAYGFGGTEAFVLDITNPFDGSGVKTGSAPAPLMWSTQYLTPSATSAYDNDLGLTTSVPAFYYAKGSAKDDFRLIFGSYYTDAVTGQMGKTVINSSVKTGAIVQDVKVNPINSCAQAFGLLSDVATARNFTAGEEVQIHAAYFGDTWGTLYRYVPGVSGAYNFTSTTGAVSTVEAFGCTQPVHYAPAIVQLDRDRGTNHPGEIYIVQVTNSALDEETKAFPASKMIIRRDLATAPGAVANDSNFTPIVLNAGVATQLCGLTNAAGTVCLEALPATARPNATPMAILKQDGSGFQIISTWYQPATDACADGITYLAIHEVTVAGGIAQKFATKLASEPVTSAVFVGNRLMFVKQSGVTDLTSVIPPGITWTGAATLAPPGSLERVRRIGWVEIP